MHNYSSAKLELLALKWAVTEKFRDYLLGSKFTVYTDNNPLAYVQTSQDRCIPDSLAQQACPVVSKVTPLLLLFNMKWPPLLLALMNGVEDCPVSCLPNFSFLSTLLAKSIASLRLLTLIKVD